MAEELSSTKASKEPSVVTNMLGYWEPRRFIYNTVLALVVMAHFISALPKAWSLLTLNAILVVFVLAVLANILYCSAYLVDWFVQISAFRDLWLGLRWLLLTLGIAIAAVFTHFIAEGFLLTI
jgi:hypothetical protein